MGGRVHSFVSERKVGSVLSFHFHSKLRTFMSKPTKANETPPGDSLENGSSSTPAKPKIYILPSLWAIKVKSLTNSGSIDARFLVTMLADVENALSEGTEDPTQPSHCRARLARIGYTFLFFCHHCIGDNTS